MKYIFFALLLSCLLFSGCAAFRRAFSRTPESMKRTPAPRRAQAAPSRRHGETGDKVFDTVFRRGKADEQQHIRSSELTDTERRLVEGGFNALPRTAKDDPAMRSVLERDQKTRDARERDVYLPGKSQFSR